MTIVCPTPKKNSLRRAVFDEKFDDLERGHPRSSTHRQKALVAHTRVDQPAVPRVVDAQMLQKLVKLAFLRKLERTLEAAGFVFRRHPHASRSDAWVNFGREITGRSHGARVYVKFHAEKQMLYNNHIIQKYYHII